jgi:hypothetical protein
VDARLEVAVAGQHRRRDQVVGDDGLLDPGVQRAGVADAGGAAVGREAEAELRQRLQQSGLGQIFGHDARTGRERSLDVRPDTQPLFDRLLRQQARRQQHAGIGGVGTGGDCGDQHVAVADLHRSRHFLFGLAAYRGIGMVVEHFQFAAAA